MGTEGDALPALWSARTVAVVGASDRPGSLGRLPVEFLQRYGFAGSVFPVRADGAPVRGLPSYASVMECPEPVDLAMLMVAAERVPAAVEDCVAAGVRVAIVCSSGFAETGEAGAALQRRVVETARGGGLRLLGPNTIGSVGVGSGLVASFSPLFSGTSTALVPGNLAFVSQSGALGYGAVSLAFERGLGLGWVVNTGNEADITATEAMLALARLPECLGVLAYVESLTDLASLRALAGTGKPVAILKAGRSAAGRRAAASHTGALATTDRVVDAALRQLGIVRVDDVDELLDVGEAFAAVAARSRRDAGTRVPTAGATARDHDREGSHAEDVHDSPHDHEQGPRVGWEAEVRGPRVAVVTTSGGSGILAADAIEAYGLKLAELSEQTRAALDGVVPAYGATANPVDVTASVMSDPALFDRALRTLVDDDGVDLVIACFCVLTGGDVDTVVTALGKAAQRSGRPVLVARTGAEHLAPGATSALRAEGIPAYPTPARAVRAAAALHQTATRHQSTTPSHLPVDHVNVVDGPDARRRSHVRHADAVQGTGAAAAGNDQASTAELPGDEPALKRLLAAHGVPVPRSEVVDDANAARTAVERVGGRAVLKAVAPGLVHKSEAGAVVVGVTPEQAARTYDRLAVLGGQVLVEEQVDGGVEVLVGVAPSPLGPVLTVGPGGVLTELLDDVALRVLPVERDDVDAMLDETRLGALLAGVRGRPPADRSSLVDLICRVQDLVLGWPPVELDLNPVAVLPDGVRVLDAAAVSTPDGPHTDAAAVGPTEGIA